MTLDQFITKYKGKKIDFDGAFQNQCMDLYRFYVKEVWEKPQTPKVKGAFQVFNTIEKGYNKFTSGEIRKGDVITWNEKLVKNGHIAVVISSTPTTVTVFQQNAPKVGDACNIATYNYKNIIGWFRPQENKTFMKVTIVANKIAWDYKAQLPVIADWFKVHSNNKLEVVFDTKETNFDTVPLAPFGNTQSVDVNWYRENITPLGTGEGTVFLMNNDQYQIPGIWGFMTYGDPEKPVRMEVACDNELSSINFPEAHLVVHRIFHEICHALYFLTGQPDRVHELLFVENPSANRSVLLNEIDQIKLQTALSKIKPMSKIKIRQIGWNDAEKGLYIGYDTMEKKAKVLAKFIEVFPDYELDESKEYNLGVRKW